MPNKVENICYKEIQKVANSQDNQWVHFYSLRFVFESCITLWQYTFLFFTCFTLFHSKILFWVNLAYLFIRDYLSLIRLHDEQTSGPLFMMVWLNRLMHHICGKTVCLTTNMILWYFINLGWFRQMEHTQWYQHWWIQFDAFDVWTLSNVYTLDNASQILPSAGRCPWYQDITESQPANELLQAKQDDLLCGGESRTPSGGGTLSFEAQQPLCMDTKAIKHTKAKGKIYMTPLT